MSQPPVSPKFIRSVPHGDDRERSVCAECGFIDYQNPKIVVGSVIAVEGGVLMCRRAIEPRRGFWTLPAGFLELHETVEDGAAREAREEACVSITVEGLLAVYSIPRISQVQLMFRARLAREGFAPGPESLEVAVFPWTQLPPPEEIAFPSVVWALGHHARWRAGEPGPFFNPV